MKKVIGFKAIFDAIKKGRLISAVIDPDKKDSSKVREIIKSGVKIEWKKTQNVAEGFVDFKVKKIDNIINELTNKEKSIVVVLDQIQDTGNFGAIIRSADAFNVDLIIVPNKNSVVMNDKVMKISTGSAANVNIVEVPNLVDVIEKLKGLNYWVYGAEASGDKNYRGAFEKKACIVMGNESEGMRKRVREACDFLVTIPINTDSLNVSHACSILLCEAANG